MMGRNSKRKKANKAFAKVLALTKAGDLENLKAFLAKGDCKDLNQRDEQEWTPLCWAVFNGYLDIAKELIAAGSWVNVKDSQGRSPLYFASGWGGEYGESGEFTRFLLNSAANINAVTNDDWSPLYLSAFKGRTEVARELLKDGADIFLSDTQQRTPYDIALMRKHDDIKVLIRKTAEEKLRLSAAKGETSEMKRLLINNPFGIDVNAQDKDGFSALHFAMKYGRETAVKLLIDNLADPLVETNAGDTPQDLAAQQGNIVLLKLYKKFFSETGVDVELPSSGAIVSNDDRGNSAIKAASESNLRNNSLRKMSIPKLLHRSGSRSNLSLGSVSTKSAELYTPRSKLINELGLQMIGALSKDEKVLAYENPHLRGLVQQAKEIPSTYDALAFSNLAYGTFMAHQEEIVNSLEKVSVWNPDEVNLLNRSFGLRTQKQVSQWAAKYIPPVEGKPIFKPEPLVKHYLTQATEDELDDIIIDPELAKEYIHMMDGGTKSESFLREPAAEPEIIMNKLLASHKTSDPPISLRRSGSSHSLLRKSLNPSLNELN